MLCMKGLRLASGLDLVSVQRFARWLLYPERMMLKVFHPSEVEELRRRQAQNSHAAQQFLASRFAVKEALFKALSDAVRHGQKRVLPPFLALARATYLEASASGVPMLRPSIIAPWIAGAVCDVTVSLSHEACCAGAVVGILFEPKA